MNKLFRSFSILAFAASLMAARAADAELRKTIEALEQKWVTAWNNRDADALAALYTTDAQRLEPDEGVTKGVEALRAASAAYFKEIGDRKQTVSTLDVIGSGDFVTETGLWTEKSGDGSYAADGTYAMVWKKDGSSWKVYREIWTKTREKLRLVEGLRPLEKLLGTWEWSNDSMKVSITYEAVAGGSAIASKGYIVSNNTRTEEWSGHTQYHANSRLLVDSGNDKSGRHGTSTLSIVGNKIISQGMSTDASGKPELEVSEMSFEDGGLKFSQIAKFTGGQAEPELITNILFKKKN